MPGVCCSHGKRMQISMAIGYGILFVSKMYNANLGREQHKLCDGVTIVNNYCELKIPR